jgi:hypothetical protein
MTPPPPASIFAAIVFVNKTRAETLLIAWWSVSPSLLPSAMPLLILSDFRPDIRVPYEAFPQRRFPASNRYRLRISFTNEYALMPITPATTTHV